MAVFTEVSNQEARELLRRLQMGELLSLRGIEGGIENTNYFLTCDKGEYVLTLIERLCTTFWPSLHPAPDADDPDDMTVRFNVLAKSGRAVEAAGGSVEVIETVSAAEKAAAKKNSKRDAAKAARG